MLCRLIPSISSARQSGRHHQRRKPFTILWKGFPRPMRKWPSKLLMRWRNRQPDIVEKAKRARDSPLFFGQRHNLGAIHIMYRDNIERFVRQQRRELRKCLIIISSWVVSGALLFRWSKGEDVELIRDAMLLPGSSAVIFGPLFAREIWRLHLEIRGVDYRSINPYTRLDRAPIWPGIASFFLISAIIYVVARV